MHEGEQTPGIYFNPHIKPAIAELLSEIGIDIIEAGHPAVSSEIGHGSKAIAASGTRSNRSRPRPQPANCCR